MGVDEKKERVKQFNEQTDKAKEQEFGDANLFSGMPVVRELQFEALRDPEDRPLSLGAKAKLLDRRNRFDVYVNMVCVGYLISDAQAVREALGGGERGRSSIPATVTHVSTFSPTFVVTVKMKQ